MTAPDRTSDRSLQYTNGKEANTIIVPWSYVIQTSHYILIMTSDCPTAGCRTAQEADTERSKNPQTRAPNRPRPRSHSSGVAGSFAWRECERLRRLEREPAISAIWLWQPTAGPGVGSLRVHHSLPPERREVLPPISAALVTQHFHTRRQIRSRFGLDPSHPWPPPSTMGRVAETAEPRARLG